MKSISAIHLAITEYTRETYAPRLITVKPISQYASYPAMFCPLHSNKGKEQHEKHLCNPSSCYGKYGEYTRETCTPYSICESYNVSISAMSNLFHNIVSKT